MKRITDDKMDKFREKLTSPIYRVKIKRFISFCIFILLASSILMKTTYLFRNASYNRQHVVGLKEEKKNSLDVVYIGGSAAFVFWQPLKAWNDCGFTSYLYATDNMQAENIKYYVKEVLKTQNPKVLVIDLRAFQYWNEFIDNLYGEPGIRNSTDSMNFSLDRLNMVHYCLSNRTLSDEQEKNKLSFYIDLMKYHTNYDVLKTPDNWKMINNKYTSSQKGFEWIPSYKRLIQPTCNQITEKMELGEGSHKALVDLLNYCKEEKLKVLFAVCPYFISEQDQMKYNTMEEIIKSYGFDYLNTNEHYGEMNIDFSKDFYNENHVNCFGAEKYTTFLENYLIKQYNLPDKRGDIKYSSWDTDFVSFKESEASAKQTIEKLYANDEYKEQVISTLQKTEDVFKYASLAQKPEFTILMVLQGHAPNNLPLEEISILTDWGMDKSVIQQNNSDFIGVISNNEILYANNTVGDQQYTGTIGTIGYTISSVMGDKCSIKIADTEYALQKNGLNIVVYDNKKNVVVDSATLEFSNEEASKIVH